MPGFDPGSSTFCDSEDPLLDPSWPRNTRYGGILPAFKTPTSSNHLSSDPAPTRLGSFENGARSRPGCELLSPRHGGFSRCHIDGRRTPAAEARWVFDDPALRTPERRNRRSIRVALGPGCELLPPKHGGFLRCHVDGLRTPAAEARWVFDDPALCTLERFF